MELSSFLYLCIFIVPGVQNIQITLYTTSVKRIKVLVFKEFAIHFNKIIKLSSEDIGWVSYNTYPQGVNSQFSRRTIVLSPIPLCGFSPYIIKHSSVIRWVSYNSSQFWHYLHKDGLPGALVVKSPPANVRDIKDLGSIPGSGRSLGGGHGNPLQYSCLENPMDRGAWWARVHRVTESDTIQVTEHSRTQR